MSRALKRRALPALAVAGAIALANAGMGAASAQASGGSGPVWEAAQAYSSGLPVEGLFDAASCPATGNCLAVGVLIGVSGGNPAPLLAASSDGSWGQGETAAVSGVSTPAGVEASVACMNASSCVGVGYNEVSSTNVPLAGPIGLSGSTVSPGALSALALPSTPTPASGTSEEAALASVSCTASSCTAVGYYITSGGHEEPMVATSDGGGWSLSSVSGPSAGTQGANLTAVSCPSDGPCEAVGNYIDSSGDAQSWAVQLAGSDTPHTITPPSDAVATTGTLPTAPLLLASLGLGPMMSGISCPSVGACTAVGSYGVSGGATKAMAVQISSGAVGSVTSLTGLTFALTLPTGIFCADAGDCTLNGDVVDSGGSTPTATLVTAYESAGVWSALTPLPGPPVGTLSLLSGLACSSLDECLSVGFGITESGSTLTAITPIYAFAADPLAVTTTSLPAATVGQPYSATLQSSGGAGAGTWSINNGSLPAGLSLNASTGVISGTPMVNGSASFSVQLADGPPAQTASTNLSITVAAAPPPAAPAAAPKLSFGSAKITTTGLRLALGCSGSGTCTGTAVITAVEHLSGKRPTAVTARAKKRKVTITLARGAYSLSAGQLGTVNLKLTTQARALLKRLHKISGKLTLTPTGASKPTVTRTVTFRSATKKKKR